MKQRRRVLLLGVLVLVATAAVSTAFLSGSTKTAQGRTLPMGHFKGDAPGILKFQENGERVATTFAEEDYSNRAYPSANINFAQVQAARDAATRINTRASGNTNLNSWQSVGPNGINVDPL